MHMATDVNKVFESILKVVNDGQEVLLSSHEQNKEKLALYESELNRQKALYDQLSAEASQQRQDYEQQDQKLQQVTTENSNLNETVNRLNEEVKGLKSHVEQLQALAAELQDQLNQKEKVPSPLPLAESLQLEAVEVPQGSESSSPTSVTDLPQEDQEASDTEVNQDPPDVLQGGLFSAPVDPALGPPELEAPGVMDPTAFPLAPTVSNMHSAAVARRSRSRSRPLMRGERLRSMSPGDLPQRTPQVKRSDFRRPLERYGQPDDRRRARHFRSEGREKHRRREAREAPTSRMPLPPPPPVPPTYADRVDRVDRVDRDDRVDRVDRGQTRTHQINRDKVCIAWCAKNCAAGDSCCLRHPPEPEAERVLKDCKRKHCRHGKDCQKAWCPFLHPGDGRRNHSRRTTKSRRS
eukprot:symbB.v1.2.032872.t1/scaffold4008.1/size46473/7